jgi:hypothetical protein
MDESCPDEMGNATPKLLLGGVGAARLVGVVAVLGVEGLDSLLGVEFGVACRCEKTVSVSHVGKKLKRENEQRHIPWVFYRTPSLSLACVPL